jgi:hypothetical protein
MKFFLNLNNPQLRCFIGAIKDSTIETQGRAGIGVYSTALSTGLTTI